MELNFVLLACGKSYEPNLCLLIQSLVYLVSNKVNVYLAHDTNIDIKQVEEIVKGNVNVCLHLQKIDHPKPKRGRFPFYLKQCALKYFIEYKPESLSMMHCVFLDVDSVILKDPFKIFDFTKSKGVYVLRNPVGRKFRAKFHKISKFLKVDELKEYQNPKPFYEGCMVFHMPRQQFEEFCNTWGAIIELEKKNNLPFRDEGASILHAAMKTNVSVHFTTRKHIYKFVPKHSVRKLALSFSTPEIMQKLFPKVYINGCKMIQT